MICLECVTPHRLKRLIAERGHPGDCQYCEQPRPLAVQNEFLFKFIYDRVAENVATADDLSPYEYALVHEFGSSDIEASWLDIALAEWFGLQEEPYFDDLYNAAPPSLRSDNENVPICVYRDDGALERNFFEDEWERFVEGTKHSHRFFNPKARDFLTSVFSFLTRDGALKSECIREIQPGEHLFRARRIDTYSSVKEFLKNIAKGISPPPKGKAGNQRMTPAGIPALYCALDRSTCLSEIRSITGDKVVSVALTPITTIKLLDLTKLHQVKPDPLTLLDEGYLEACHLKTFISSLVQKMSRPQGQDDALSYLSTQIVFEFLRVQYGREVDGLVFPSVQTNFIGTNVVLFPEASGIAVGTEAVKDGEAQPEILAGPFVTDEPSNKLAVVPKEVRYHRVTAIETKSEQFDEADALFMDALVLRRLGPIYTPISS